MTKTTRRPNEREGQLHTTKADGLNSNHVEELICDYEDDEASHHSVADCRPEVAKLSRHTDNDAPPVVLLRLFN